MRTLVIGNKVYSSWSLRTWLLLKQYNIAFDEVMVPLDTPETAHAIARYSPAGRVPVFVDGAYTVWDTLAIIEHVAETLEPNVWPSDPHARAMARSISAEMHAGFQALRAALPMNLGKRYARRERADIAADVRRIIEIVNVARDRFGHAGPFLFGAFSAADAMYAPVMTRLDTYDVTVPPAVRTYIDTILSLPAYREWLHAALDEPWVIRGDEPAEAPVEDLRSRLATRTETA